MDGTPVRHGLQRVVCSDCGGVLANNEFARTQHQRSPAHRAALEQRDWQRKRAERANTEAELRKWQQPS